MRKGKMLPQLLRPERLTEKSLNEENGNACET
jgi:hypothetical protein